MLRPVKLHALATLRGLIDFAVTYAPVATRSLRFARLDRPAGAIVLVLLRF